MSATQLLAQETAPKGEFHFWKPAPSARGVQGLAAQIHERSGPLPLYELQDLMPASATSVNKGNEWVSSSRFSGSRQRVCHSTVEAQNRVASINGLKIDNTKAMKTKLVGGEEVDLQRANEQHVLNVMAEARHGLHKTDRSVRAAMASDKNRTGDSLNARSSGREHRQNTSTITGPPRGVPVSVQPNIPTADFERINEKLVAPIPSFIS